MLYNSIVITYFLLTLFYHHDAIFDIYVIFSSCQ